MIHAKLSNEKKKDKARHNKTKARQDKARLNAKVERWLCHDMTSVPPLILLLTLTLNLTLTLTLTPKS